MTRARQVLQAIDQAMATMERHPTLFAAHLRYGSNVERLLRSLERYKAEKPTPHARPFRDDVEPVDHATAERFAREGEEEHRGRRLRLNRIEEERRRRTPGLTLVQQAIRRAETISTVPAGNVEPSRGGGDGSLPKQQRLADDPRWQFAERQIHRQAIVLMELMDEAQGYSRSAAISALSAEDKNKAIRDEGAGLTAEELFIRLGPEYGSISFIRRYRRENGLDNRGRRVEASLDMPRPLRRTVIDP